MYFINAIIRFYLFPRNNYFYYENLKIYILDCMQFIIVAVLPKPISELS